MSNSVVPAAAAGHTKHLVTNKKLIKRAEDHKPADDQAQADHHGADAANAVQVDQAEHAQTSMSATPMSGEFSFSGALSAAADSTASLASASADGDSGSGSNDGDGAGGTILLVGAVGLVGLGVAVAAGGGGHKNEAPTVTSGATATVAENAAATTVVYTATATDPDGDTLSYSITGADAALFNINSSTGAVTLKAPADFETKASYAFSVVASDGELTSTKAVTLTVTDVVEAPTFTTGTTASIAENTAITTTVYDANIAGTAAATFSLTGADAALFNIDSATGVVTFKASPNFESTTHTPAYAIGVVATVGALSSTQNVAVTVTDVKEVTFTSATTASFAENTPTATAAYDANISAATGTFALTGADAALFNIDSATGVVTFKSSPNFESTAHGPAYNIVVSATSGGETGTQAVTINVTDVAQEGPTFTSGSSVNFAENTAPTTTVYDADATGVGGVGYSLTGADASFFNIDTTTGVVTFKASPDFESTTHTPTYTLLVNATDTVGTTQKSVTVNVTDVANEATFSNVVLDGKGNDSSLVVLDAGGGSKHYQEGDGQTNVFIQHFTNDDLIVFLDAAKISDYNFTTGTGADKTDLVINHTTPSGVTSVIVLDDVLTSTKVFNYESAKASIGFDFIQLG